MPRGRPRLTPEEKAKRLAKKSAKEVTKPNIEEVLAHRDDEWRKQNAVPTYEIKPVEGTNQFVVEVANAQNYTIEDGIKNPSQEEGWADASLDSSYQHLVRTLPDAEEIKRIKK